jgi:hypothetical protein
MRIVLKGIRNDKAGQVFIVALKASLTPGIRIKVRNRGPRAVRARQDRVPTYSAYLPKRHATHFSIYLWRKP